MTVKRGNSKVCLECCFTRRHAFLTFFADPTVCTTWGYILTSPPNPEGNHSPTHPSGPKIVSSLIDYDYAAALCKYGYPAGEHFAIPARPNISEVNDIGGFQIAMDRLAFIDGQYDPWRPATTHSEEFASGGAREDTLDRPFKLIPGQ